MSLLVSSNGGGPHKGRSLPPLPLPTRTRFQPLRLGLVELFHYDVEEFWFRDGHLLLRGNNGTGKSKVLSLTLPFLLDASLSSSRVEPDGDRTKKMEWNLLMGRYERRVGYTWIEFGRLSETGELEYVTLGCGLRAVAGRPRVESWHFITDQRVGGELSLITPERSALSRERLIEALGARGQVFDTAKDYRRAINERLFRLGDRYDALIDTLVQLRQPQLSKKPDEQSLSLALSNAMPELPRPLLEDVAEAMNQLEEYREELAHIDRVREAVSQFQRRYRLYAQIRARRQARVVRKAQTEFDKQSAALNHACEQLARARDTARSHESCLAALELELGAQRAVVDELKADPTMSDARRLTELAEQVKRATRECERTRNAHEQARSHLEREAAESQGRASEVQERAKQAKSASSVCLEHAQHAGMEREHESAVTAVDGSAGRAEDDFRRLERELLGLSAKRRGQLDRVRERKAACDQAGRKLELVEERCSVHREQVEKTQADARRTHGELEIACSELLAAWRAYLGDLRALALRDVESGLGELELWLESVADEQPMRALVDAALRAGEAELASAASALADEQRVLLVEDEALARELDALRAGVPPVPQPLPTRDATLRVNRPGGPFYGLFEFRKGVSDAERAGVEAALEAAGLLDAWVMPDASVLHPDTEDAWLEPEPPVAQSLARWLEPVEGPVPVARLEALLSGIASGEDDDETAHTFVSASGRFRVGSLRGAFHKLEARYVGHTARERARRRRIEELTVRREELAQALAVVRARVTELEVRRATLRDEARAAPKDDPVHTAHARHAAQEALRREAFDALAAVEAEHAHAERRLREAEAELDRDARDLRLPTDAVSLATVETALAAYDGGVRVLKAALETAARARIEHARQLERERAAKELAAECAHDATTRTSELSEVSARHELLRGSVGAAVEELTAKLSQASARVTETDKSLKHERTLYDAARDEATRFDQQTKDAEVVLDDRAGERKLAVKNLSDFAATGLLTLALPNLTVPDKQPWTVEPALTVSRQVEQQLTTIASEDSDWARVQNEISRDFTTLGQALSGLGQRAQMEQTDFGLIVQIVYQNRPERPDVLERMLASEVEQRKAILSAREREVLENHLQAEVAAVLQRLLREAESQVERINVELKKRPTSTGVFFRLDWEPREDEDDSAAGGLSAIRTRLLRRAADAWSSEDRRAVGEFLAARIAKERARDDSGSLVEHLARALDYRAWHRFRVKRWHDGGFRPLSGPASSGERALGLTVPLFAAASSHYASGALHAPRLVLLDEAFAGIDDEARAHCMALIREFDLDFVMTSEREWGCYATLPGVSICHIVRREGVDGAFVSRWTWDGQGRRAEPDPTRRFETAGNAHDDA